MPLLAVTERTFAGLHGLQHRGPGACHEVADSAPPNDPLALRASGTLRAMRRHRAILLAASSLVVFAVGAATAHAHEPPPPAMDGPWHPTAAMELIIGDREGGFVPEPYDDDCRPSNRLCGKGNCTVGFGHLVHHGPCDGAPSEAIYRPSISETQGLTILRSDIEKRSLALVDRWITIPLDELQLVALADLAFNCNSCIATPPPRAKPGTRPARPSRITVLVNQHRFLDAANALDQYSHEKGKNGKVGGLQNRRAAEAFDLSYGHVGHSFRRCYPLEAKYGLCGSPAPHSKPFRVVFGNAHGLGLWVTNGTTGGTERIFVSHLGISPEFLTPFENSVLFGGSDGLWVTSGTAKSTRRLPGPTSALAIAAGTSQAFAIGQDRSGTLRLWVTDGSSAHELASIPNEPAGGLWSDRVVPEIVTVGNTAVFEAVDNEQRPSLWISDGTAAGTHEVWSQPDCPACGIQPAPANLTVAGSRVYFSLINTFGVGPADALWYLENGNVTHLEEPDRAGRLIIATELSELATGGGELYFDGPEVPFAYSNGTAAGTAPFTFPPLRIGEIGTLGDLTPVQHAVLFSSDYAENNPTLLRGQLWRAEPSAPAQEVASGLPVGTYLDPSSITAFGSSALFYGSESSGARALWLTDGVTAQPLEAGATAARAPTGLSLGLVTCEDLIVVGGVALFDQPPGGLGITSGTPAGTHSIFRHGDADFCPDYLTAIP